MHDRRDTESAWKTLIGLLALLGCLVLLFSAHCRSEWAFGKLKGVQVAPISILHTIQD